MPLARLRLQRRRRLAEPRFPLRPDLRKPAVHGLARPGAAAALAVEQVNPVTRPRVVRALREMQRHPDASERVEVVEVGAEHDLSRLELEMLSLHRHPCPVSARIE